MLRRVFCKLLLVAVAVFWAFSGVLLAQGRSADAFERVKQVQEANTARLLAMEGVEGTAIGLNHNGEPVVKVFTARSGVAGIPKKLDGVPVEIVVSGKIYALKPPTNKPPKAPRALTATVVSNSQINLDWKDNREAGVTYNVYSSTSSGDYVLGEPFVADLASSSYSDKNLTAGTTYYYVVTAENEYGESSFSNEVSATTEGGVINPPAAPSGLSATAVSSSQINLSWTDNSNNESGFRIERLNGASFSEIATVGAGITSYSNTGLNPSIEYTYRVCSYNSAGDSGYSNEASDTTFAGPATPIDPSDRFTRPVPIGVSTGHPDITAGTIGCRVTDGIKVYALSNNHVYANENRATVGDAVIQPGTADGGALPDDKIGTLAAFVPIEFGMFGYNTIDVAIAECLGTLDNSTPIGLGGGYGIPNSITSGAYINQSVQKYGRTTGLTTGTIADTNGAFLVRYSRSFAIFYNQIVIEDPYFSAGGDSGSLIVTNDSDCKPIGLLFAGSDTTTIANPIDDVLSALSDITGSTITIDGN
jgi:hypothetical protein